MTVSGKNETQKFSILRCVFPRVSLVYVGRTVEREATGSWPDQTEGEMQVKLLFWQYMSLPRDCKKDSGTVL